MQLGLGEAQADEGAVGRRCGEAQGGGPAEERLWDRTTDDERPNGEEKLGLHRVEEKVGEARVGFQVPNMFPKKTFWYKESV